MEQEAPSAHLEARQTVPVVGTSEDATSLIEALERPDRLWTRAEVLERPSPVPPVPGVYGWHFTRPPADPLEADRLLYVGIAPRHIRTRSSTQNLRNHFRHHPFYAHLTQLRAKARTNARELPILGQ